MLAETLRESPHYSRRRFDGHPGRTELPEDVGRGFAGEREHSAAALQPPVASHHRRESHALLASNQRRQVVQTQELPDYQNEPAA